MTAYSICFLIFIIFIAANVVAQHPCKTLKDNLNRLSIFCDSDDLKEIPELDRSIEVS